MSRTALIAVAVVLLLCINGLGCAGPGAPRYYSISREFSEDEATVLRAAVEAWCEASGDCPEEGLFSERAHFELVDDLPEDAQTERACPEGGTCSTNGKERAGTIRVARNRAPGLDILWRIAAHEWGHLCIEGHREQSALMSAYQAPEGVLEVDAEAVEAWREGCP